MIGATLATLRTKVKQLTQTELSVDTADVNSIDGLLNLAQRELAVAFDWEQLRHREEASVSTWRNTLPTTIDWDRQVSVSVRDANIWRPVAYGITDAHWSVYAVDDTSDPIRRWQRYGLTEYEVWPTPATAQTLRFSGHLAFSDMSEDDETAVIDDVLLALAVATEILTQQESKAAPFMLQRYQKREAQLRRNTNISSREYTLGGAQRRRYNHYFGPATEDEGVESFGPLFGRTDPVFGSHAPVFGED